jgi:hypothetical protein
VLRLLGLHGLDPAGALEHGTPAPLAEGAASARTVIAVASPSPAMSSALVPSAISRPSSMVPIRSQSRSASSM